MTTVAPTTTKTLLRFATAGSVDDGKSTLVGRLLHDAKAILADQLAAVTATSGCPAGTSHALSTRLLTRCRSASTTGRCARRWPR